MDKKKTQIDLKPILFVEKQLQQQTQELQKLEQEIEQMIDRLKQEQECLTIKLMS